MKFTVPHYMIQVLDLFDDAKARSKDATQIRDECKVLMEHAKAGLKLKREIQAVQDLIDTCHTRNNVHNLTLAYMYEGELYCVHKSENVPGTLCTRVLHDRSLPMGEWDKMHKYNLWVHSGIINSTFKV